MKEKYYKNVLVTGCNGFVGKELCKRLKREGRNVFGVDIIKDKNTQVLNFSNVDISKFDEVKDNIPWKRIDYVYHLAAIANLDYARKRVAEYPSIPDQLDKIYNDGIDAWKATIKAVKDKYPKP